MPFGPRPVPQVPEHSLDFDRVYRELIHPAGEAAGWIVRRIDELPEPGSISDQYLREIYAADLLLADISIPNENVYSPNRRSRRRSTADRAYSGNRLRAGG